MTKPRWSIISAIPCEDYTLDIIFADGTFGSYDATPLLDRPVFAPLKSIAFFMLAHAEHSTVAWNEDIDIAPEHLYKNCKRPRGA